MKRASLVIWIGACLSHSNRLVMGNTVTEQKPIALFLIDFLVMDMYNL